VNGFANALPGYIDDITHRRGRLGFLESKYHITQRVRDQLENGGCQQAARANRHRDRDHEGDHHGDRRDGDRSSS
jgi:hypothetical protein